MSVACDSDSGNCAFLDAQMCVITRPSRSDGSLVEADVQTEVGCYICSDMSATWPSAFPNVVPFRSSEVEIYPFDSIAFPLHGGGLLPLESARENFDRSLGGPEEFDSWFVDSE